MLCPGQQRTHITYTLLINRLMVHFSAFLEMLLKSRSWPSTDCVISLTPVNLSHAVQGTTARPLDGVGGHHVWFEDELLSQTFSSSPWQTQRPLASFARGLLLYEHPSSLCPAPLPLFEHVVSAICLLWSYARCLSFRVCYKSLRAALMC